MGLIKDKLNNLKEADLYSIILFALAKLRDMPEYYAISELCYILDKKSLVKLCQIFGGVTLTVPTLNELEILTYSLLLYEYVDINNIPFDDAFKNLCKDNINSKSIKESYIKIKELLADYDISSRSSI